MQRAVTGQIRPQRPYASLTVLLAITAVLLRDTLLGDKGRGVVAPRLYQIVAYKQLLHALSGWVFDWCR